VKIVGRSVPLANSTVEPRNSCVLRPKAESSPPDRIHRTDRHNTLGTTITKARNEITALACAVVNPSFRRAGDEVTLEGRAKNPIGNIVGTVSARRGSELGAWLLRTPKRFGRFG
jgi:hypothetical protein